MRRCGPLSTCTLLLILCSVAIALSDQQKDNNGISEDEVLTDLTLVSRGLQLDDDGDDSNDDNTNTNDVIDNLDKQILNLDDQQNMLTSTDQHTRVRRRIKKLKNKLRKIKKKVNRFLGAPGSPKREKVNTLVRHFVG